MNDDDEATPRGEHSEKHHKTAICPFCHGSFVVDATHIMELQRGAAISEPQEWTQGDRNRVRTQRGSFYCVSESDAIWCIADHEAALGVERERFDTLQRQAEELHGRAQRAERELADEREKREGDYFFMESLRHQREAAKAKKELLAAQAAIKQHNSEKYPGHRAIDVDLSALREHESCSQAAGGCSGRCR